MVRSMPPSIHSSIGRSARRQPPRSSWDTQFTPTGKWGGDRGDPLTRVRGEGILIHNEIHEMGEPFTCSDWRVLFAPGLADPNVAEAVRGIPDEEPVHRADRDFAAAWVKRYVEGKVFYGSCAEPFENPVLVRYLGCFSVRARRSRRDESMTIAAPPKARPGADTRI